MQLTVPEGYEFFTHGGGLRYTGRDDLALMLSHLPAVPAGVFTRNRFQAAPVIVARERIQSFPGIRAVLVNSGQANACTGEQGVADCRRSTELVAREFSLGPEEILPASTGVIGEPLPMPALERALPGLATGRSGAADAARAITTTDKFPKLSGERVEVSGGETRILGLAKGAGMICPNMATMLGFVLCDALVEPGLWQEMLCSATEKSFNSITVDGDSSTNDCVLALANGAGCGDIRGKDEQDLYAALENVCRDLAHQIVQDAEGGTKVLNIRVAGAGDNQQAESAARAVGNSPLVKTAMYGNDPNWGRIVAALGRCGADFSPQEVRVFIGPLCIFEKGRPAEMDIDAAFARFLRCSQIDLYIELGSGPGEYTLQASDLTHEYVNINAEYRT